MTDIQVNAAIEFALLISAVVLGVVAFKRTIFWLIVIVLEHWLARTSRK